jgi:hypothetical protein
MIIPSWPKVVHTFADGSNAAKCDCQLPYSSLHCSKRYYNGPRNTLVVLHRKGVPRKHMVACSMGPASKIKSWARTPLHISVSLVNLDTVEQSTLLKFKPRHLLKISIQTTVLTSKFHERRFYTVKPKSLYHNLPNIAILQPNIYWLRKQTEMLARSVAIGTHTRCKQTSAFL